MDEKPNPPPPLSSDAKEFVPSQQVDAQRSHDRRPAGQADTYPPLPAGRAHYPNPYGGSYISDPTSIYGPYHLQQHLSYVNLRTYYPGQDLQQYDNTNWLQQQQEQQRDYNHWLRQQQQDREHRSFRGGDHRQQQQQQHREQRSFRGGDHRQQQQQQQHREQRSFRGGDHRQQQQQQQDGHLSSVNQQQGLPSSHIVAEQNQQQDKISSSKQQQQQLESPSDSAAAAASSRDQIQPTSSRSRSGLHPSPQAASKLQEQSEQHQGQERTEEHQEENMAEENMENAYTIEMSLPPHIEESNLLYMFKKKPQHVWKHGRMGQVQFSSYTEALQAQSIWAVPEKIHKAHPTDFRRHEFMKPYGDMKPVQGTIRPKRQRQEEVGMSSSQTETAQMKRLKRDSLEDHHYKWCTIEKFSKEAPEKELVRPFSFTTGAIKGSVSPDIKRCVAGPMCHYIFMSLFIHAFSTHLSGRTWKGKINRRDLCISKSMQLCAILRKTVKLTCDDDMISDIVSIISNIEPLYTVNGFWPPYYEEMLSLLKAPPTRSNPKDLEDFHRDVLKRPAFSTPEIRSHVVQEFYSNTFEFKRPDWKTFNKSAPINLEDWPHITKVDKLLKKVKDESSGMGRQFGRQSHYMRHLVVHAPDDKRKRKKACDDEGDGSDGKVLFDDKKKMKKACDDEDNESDGEESELDDQKERLQVVASAEPLGDQTELWPPLTKAPAPLTGSASAQVDVSALPCTRPPKPTRKGVNLGDFVSQAYELKGIHIGPSPPHPPPPPAKVSWDITERDMMGLYYFKQFMATFVDHMYKEKDNQRYLEKICRSYENGLPKLGCIPHQMIPDEYMEELEEEVSGSEGRKEMEED